MDLRAPSLDLIPGYIDALQRGWCNESAREDVDGAHLELAEIRQDPEAFVALLNHPTRGGTPVTLEDGARVARLPGVRRWMWDGEYGGAISVRWQPGTTDLPPYCLGHIGYAVVPWKRGRGYATKALHQMLAIARDNDLPFVEIVTALTNVASQAVVLANGGVAVEEFTTPPESGRFAAIRFRVDL
jgi:predicted acetyltransferase